MTKPKGIQTTKEKLPFLLKQKEGTSLEFKREVYKLDIGGEGEKRQKGELVKDILSLVNGNVLSVGETAYLVIGASNEFNPDGKRDLFDVDSDGYTDSRIIDIVNEYIEPKLVDISVESILYEGKKLLVITIPATPHLYETIKVLDTKDRSYSEYTAFIRRNEQTKVASTREREAIRKLKELYFAEARNPSPIPFGGLIGSLIGMLLLAQYGKNQFGTIAGQIGGGVAGLFSGAILGAELGAIYKNLKEAVLIWRKTSVKLRILAIAILAIVFVIIFLSVRYFFMK